ncbi:MAG TPA: methyltransferase domain-containing protein [Thermoanaerobaculia bacterium]|nr:methyltransferase domain-containing protein [Thermoanaerobaculia bacterium]
MRRSLLDLLRCPDCGGSLALHDDVEEQGQIRSGELRCAACPTSWPIVDFIPRFVGGSYAGNFGFQWQLFAGTQLDSHSRVPISRQRFYGYSGWTPESLAGQRMLDAGCGAGRFAEIALEAGAEVVAVDISSSVVACHQNLGHYERLHVIQCDLSRMPFADGVFDGAYCFGVLQHTPSPATTFASIAAKVRKGGRLAVDVYKRSLYSFLLPQYWLRPLLRRLPRPTLYRVVQWLVRVFLPLSNAVGRLPFGRKIRRLLPVANHHGLFPLTDAQHREWSTLDTFDMFSPAHDHPQTAAALRRWFAEAGFTEHEVFRSGFLVGRGIK